MTSRVTAAFALVAACGAAALLHAQQPTFRARVDHVSIDVVVTDKDERPVVGLTAADFEIREHDRVQTIADLSYVTIPPRTEPVDLDAPPLPPRDVAMNARSTERSRAIVILVNEASINPREGDIEPTRRILGTLIQGLAPDDQAALIYVKSSDFSQDFTNDTGRLITAASHLRAAMSASSGPDRRGRTVQFAFENARKSLDAATQPRKLLIYVGETGPQGDPPLWLTLLNEVRQAGIPVYPIDPVATQVFQPPQLAHFQEPTGFPVFSENTGGRSILHPGDPVATAHDLMVENGSYYLLGYYPSPFERDGKFHDVSVHVLNHPGVHVRAREGYRSPKAADATAAPNDVRAMNAALAGGLDDPGLPVQVFATPIEPAPNGGMRTLVTTTVVYPPRDAGTPRLDDELRFGILALDPDAGVKAEHHRVVPLKGTASAGALTLVIDDEIDLPAKVVTLRVGVESRARGATGTAHLELDVPDARKGNLTLSGIVIGWAGDHGALDLNPEAIAGLAPFHPTTTRTFGAGDQIRVYGRAFWKANAATGRVDATVRISGSTFERSVPLTASRTGNFSSASLDTTVPLQGLTAGTHVLTVTVTGPKPDATATRQVVFEIR